MAVGVAESSHLRNNSYRSTSHKGVYLFTDTSSGRYHYGRGYSFQGHVGKLFFVPSRFASHDGEITLHGRQMVEWAQDLETQIVVESVLQLKVQTWLCHVMDELICSLFVCHSTRQTTRNTMCEIPNTVWTYYEIIVKESLPITNWIVKFLFKKIYFNCWELVLDGSSIQWILCNVKLNDTMYTFGNCQRPVFSLGVSLHMHKITLWKFGLNWSLKLPKNDERKNTLGTK